MLRLISVLSQLSSFVIILTNFLIPLWYFLYRMCYKYFLLQLCLTTICGILSLNVYLFHNSAFDYKLTCCRRNMLQKIYSGPQLITSITKWCAILLRVSDHQVCCLWWTMYVLQCMPSQKVLIKICRRLGCTCLVPMLLS